MQVVVFALAGTISLIVILLIFRATAAELGRRFHWAVFVGWGILYGFVGMQVAWTLRPWIGAHYHNFKIIRWPFRWSLYEKIWFVFLEIMS